MADFGLRIEERVKVQLPMVVVDEFLDRFPFGTTESYSRISKIDQTSNLNVVWDSEDLLDLWFSTGGGGPVNGQTCGET
jgi:hypothetical protein